ncbi:UNVERIFIED_CONTAM: Methyltransferase-like protein 4 [Trichonephila clavipes]
MNNYFLFAFQDQLKKRENILKHDEDKAKKRVKNKKGTLQTNSLENAIITEKATCLIQAAKDLNFIKSSDISSVEWFENNCEARKAAKEALNLSLDGVPSEYCNKNNESTIVIFGSEKYVLPAKSSFHLCDVKSLENLKGKKYDLIVLDPPWENKSVWRKKSYKTLDSDSLLNLPIDVICNPGCLIVVWITQRGYFIHSIDWHHKKPYENLLLGYVSREFGNKSLIVKTEIEPHKVILSVPSSIHSHKPPLPEILKPYIPEDANCLELFARYLLPKWTSVGNEVIKLQNINLFEKVS